MLHLMMHAANFSIPRMHIGAYLMLLYQKPSHVVLQNALVPQQMRDRWKLEVHCKGVFTHSDMFMLVAAGAAVSDNGLGRQPQQMSLVDSTWCPSDLERHVPILLAIVSQMSSPLRELARLLALRSRFANAMFCHRRDSRRVEGGQPGTQGPVKAIAEGIILLVYCSAHHDVLILALVFYSLLVQFNNPHSYTSL